MGRLAALVLFGLVVAVVVLALQAPASWVAHRISESIGGSVRVIEAEGTIWDGRGVLTSPDGRWKVPVAWHLKAAPLVRGEIEVELTPQPGLDTPRGTLRLSRTGFATQGLVLDLPATILESAFAGRSPATFGGDIRLDARDLAVEGQQGSGGMTMRWERARLVAPDGTSVSLGIVTAQFVPRDGALVGRISNSGGEVAVAGTMTMSRTGVGLDATLAPRTGASEAVVHVLRALGPPDADGAVQLRWVSERR
ncbi:MAG: type II secretion system protein N [Betaproteobacteria bacterium]